ncbi:MAG: hypothetical protein ACT4OK_18190 [Gemmobacter sp.]
MTRHLADHRTPSQGARLMHFLRIARAEAGGMWRLFARRPQADGAGNRRVVEFARIARGRET